MLANFLLTLLLAASASADAANDPCTNYAMISEWKRSTNFTLESSETPLCDSDLQMGWYRFNSSAGDRMPETCPGENTCGTRSPIWLRGGHPTSLKRLEYRQACAHFTVTASNADPCCQQSVDIGVMNCGAFYIYALYPTPACPMAYCAGDGETCPAGQFSRTGLKPCHDAFPDMTVAPSLGGPKLIEQTRDQNSRFEFTCEIHYPGDGNPDTAFEVMWVVGADESLPIKHEVVREPLRTAVLNNTDLRGHYGNRLKCLVRPFYTSVPKNMRGPWKTSNLYWVGVKVEPGHLTVSEAEGQKSVAVTFTVPIVCDYPHANPKDCCVNVKLNAQKNVAFDHVCEKAVCTNDWKEDISSAHMVWPVVASRDQIPETTDRRVVLRFQLEDHANMELNDMNEVQVLAKDAPVAKCYAGGDPHFQSIEQHRYEHHLFLRGDFTFYQNKDRHFEVQIRTWQCGRGVTCICGVAIREKDDVIRIDGCKEWVMRGNRAATPEISVYRPISDGTTVEHSTDGKEIYVYLPSSTELKIEGPGNYMQVTQTIPGQDKGHGEGICGTFDGNPNNELTHRGGHVDTSCRVGHACVPNNFMESWRVGFSKTSYPSLFKDEEVPDALNERQTNTYCICDQDAPGSFMYINCTARGDITGRKLHCSGSGNCKETKLNRAKCGFQIGGNNTCEPQGCEPFCRRWGTGRRRAVTYTDADEVEEEYDPDSYPDFKPAILTWPTPVNHIDEATAERKCREALQESQLYSACSQHDQIMDIESCKLDIQVSDGYDFVDAFVDGFTTNCQLSLAADATNYVTDSASGETVLKTSASMAQLCSSSCMKHGTCRDGRCVCQQGFTGDNCQLEAGKGPQLHGIRGSRFCDINQRPCRAVYINASNVAISDFLACKVQEVMPDGSFSTDRSNLLQEGRFITAVKLGCAIPDAQVKTDRSVKEYVISATTDGQLYGSSVSLTVFDSTCMNCSESGCQQLPNTCLINNLCYLDRDRNPKDASKMCLVVKNASKWTQIYPLAQASVTGPATNHSIECTIQTIDTDPNARYKVSWYVGGELVSNTREQDLPIGRLSASVDRLTLPNEGPLTCKVRSLYTDYNILSPYNESSALDLSASPLYPIITVQLRPTGSAVECTVHPDAQSPDARYKVSWFVDGRPYPRDRELSIQQGQEKATYALHDLPDHGNFTCKIRSFFSTLHIISPYVISNGVDLSGV